MRLKHAKTLITGKPGVGKTTLVQKIIKRMESINMAGSLYLRNSMHGISPGL